MSEVRVNSTSNYSPVLEKICTSKLLLMTGIVLAVIGILAAKNIFGLNSISSNWYFFEIGAAICFFSSCCCSCKNNIQNQKTVPHSQVERAALPNPTHNIHRSEPKKISKTPSELFQEALYAEHHDKNLSKAAHLYYEATQKGHVDSFFHMGRCYENGIGTAKDMDKAFIFYKQAATQDHIEAIYTLAAKAFDNGNEEEGFVWAKKGASLESSQGRETFQKLISSYEDKNRPRNTQTEELGKELVITIIRTNIARLEAARKTSYALAPWTIV